MLDRFYKILIITIIVCTCNTHLVTAKTFDKKSVNYPIMYLDWHIDLYKIDTEVDLSIKDIERDVHTLGCINYTERTIKVSDRVKTKQREEEIVYHEIGHLINKYYIPMTEDVNFIKAFEKDKDNVKRISKEYYVDLRIEEYMSECYMLYMEEPTLLKKKAPTTFDYINNKINYYFVNKRGKLLGKNTNNTKRGTKVLTTSEDNRIVDDKGTEYLSLSLIIKNDKEVLSWGEDSYVKNNYLNILKDYTSKNVNINPSSIYVIDLSTYKSFTNSDKCTLVNFLLDGGLKDIKFNLFNQSEDFIKERISHLKELGY